MSPRPFIYRKPSISGLFSQVSGRLVVTAAVILVTTAGIAVGQVADKPSSAPPATTATTGNETSPGSSGEAPLNSSVEALVYHCNDGDTCRVQIAGAMWMNVRLAGIDAPEVSHGKKKPGQPYGNEARDFMNGKLKGQTVMIHQTDLDQYNRPVVEIRLKDGTLINTAAVAGGYAEVYRGKAKRLDRTPYFAAETTAKKAQLGIWGIKNYESPSDFRKAQRGH